MLRLRNLTATAASAIGVPRARIRAVYWVSGAAAGSVSFKNGGSGATELIKIDTPALATHTGYLIFPGEGVLFSADPYVTITNATSVTFFFYGWRMEIKPQLSTEREPC